MFHSPAKMRLSAWRSDLGCHPDPRGQFPRQPRCSEEDPLTLSSGTTPFIPQSNFICGQKSGHVGLDWLRVSAQSTASCVTLVSAKPRMWLTRVSRCSPEQAASADVLLFSPVSKSGGSTVFLHEGVRLPHSNSYVYRYAFLQQLHPGVLLAKEATGGF